MRCWMMACAAVIALAYAGFAEAQGRPAAVADDTPYPPAVSGAFVFENWAGPPLRVHFAVPQDARPDTPIVMVHHGMSRNADDYRDNWLDIAAACTVIAVAPEFDRERFTGSANYNLGSVLDPFDRVRPRETWTFSAVEPLFDTMVETLGSTRTGYAMFGHSAGSQFVHRFAMHVPENRADVLLPANAGWYTLPRQEIEWPYGLRGSRVSEEGVEGFLAANVVVLLGDQDTDPEDDSLRKTPEAKRQGPHRYARGFNFFETAQAEAAKRGVAFNWTLETVPGVGHQNRGMALAAAKHVLDDPAAASPACKALVGIED